LKKLKTCFLRQRFKMNINLNDICKNFGSIKVLNNVNINIDKLECVGIIGPNGAGKSTLFNIITGNINHDSGNIIFNGNSLDNISNENRVRLGIVQSFQKNSLFLEMTVLESIMISMSHKLNLSFEFLRPLSSNRLIKLKALDLIKDIGLHDYIDYKSESLSYGLQRQLELGIAIACNPELLLLDEPTAGMSPAETKSIINLIKMLSKNYPILIVEHDMEVIYNLADRIFVLDRGEIIFSGKPEEVKKSKLVQNKYLGVQNV